MEYKLIKNQAKELMKGFKGHFFGLLAIAVVIQIIINAVILYILPDNIFLTMAVSIVAQAIIVPSLLGIVKYAIEKREKANYSFVMPSGKVFFKSLGIISINNITSQVVIGMMIIPGIIIGVFSATVLPIGLIGIFMVIGLILMSVVKIFIYMQALLAVSEVLEGKGFVDSMTYSWGMLFKNFKFFIRTTCIMIPVVVIPLVGIIGILIIALIGMVASDLALGLLLVFLILFLVMIVVTLVLAIIYTPKLFSIVYLGYKKIKENVKYNDMNNIVEEKTLV